MAKIEGAQSIPSELKELYDGTITPKSGVNIVRRRYPWRKPNKQLGGYKVTDAEKAQRQRWLEIITKFKTLDTAARQRWYASLPIYPTNLWYFNYFQMSGLKGVVEVNGMGGGVIKDIHHYTFAFASGTAPDATIAIDTCDPEKSVPFFFGAAFGIVENMPVPVYPYLKSLNSTQLVAGSPMELDRAANLSVSLIEYI